MNSASDLILAELGGVEEIVRTAHSIESERQGCSVDRHDTNVQLLAAEIILNGAGAKLRARVQSAKGRRATPR